MIYNTRIYNYSNLSDENKKTIDRLIDVGLSSIYNIYAEYAEEEEFATNLIDKMRYEERKEALKEASGSLVNDIIELIVVMIDADTNEIEEKNTDDYFYGYKWADYVEELGIFEDEEY